MQRGERLTRADADRLHRGDRAHRLEDVAQVDHQRALRGSPRAVPVLLAADGPRPSRGPRSTRRDAVGVGLAARRPRPRPSMESHVSRNSGSHSPTLPARPIVRAMLRVSATACSSPTSTVAEVAGVLDAPRGVTAQVEPPALARLTGRRPTPRRCPWSSVARPLDPAVRVRVAVRPESRRHLDQQRAEAVVERVDATRGACGRAAAARPARLTTRPTPMPHERVGQPRRAASSRRRCSPSAARPARWRPPWSTRPASGAARRPPARPAARPPATAR